MPPTRWFYLRLSTIILALAAFVAGNANAQLTTSGNNFTITGVDVDVTASRLASRRDISGELAMRIDAAVRAGHLPAQDTALAATALLGALHEALVGPLAPANLDDPIKLRDAVQTVTLLALRAVGVMDARARGLVVQATTPAKALVGA